MTASRTAHEDTGHGPRFRAALSELLSWLTSPRTLGGELVVTTIITIEEQMRGWLAAINKLPAGLSQVDAYTSLTCRAR
jgi:hypothetical protein